MGGKLLNVHLLMKKNIFAVFGLCASFLVAQATSFSVKSPDGKLEAIVNDGSKLTLTIKADGKTVFDAFKIGMKTDKGDFGSASKAKGSTHSQTDGNIKRFLK